jgi:peptidylprolyl isomerase domain and WD repeat-containing protein 1
VSPVCVARAAFPNVAYSHRTDFIITTSVDGHLKLWKKQVQGIEFVKHYRAHLAPIVSVSGSADGQLFASIAEDGSAKVFDVLNFGACESYALIHHPSWCDVALVTDMPFPQT